MKILLFIKRLDYGGAENHVLELANELVAQGQDVVLLAKNGRKAQQLSEAIDLVHRVHFSELLLIQIVQLVWLIRTKRIELIHAHQRMPILAASIVGYLMNIPVVATIHGRPRYDLRSWFSRRLPSLFIFVSYTVLTISRHYSQIRDRSVFIPNCISVSDKKLDFIPFSFAYVSRIDASHAHVISLILDIIPDLLKKYADLQFFVYGDGPYLDSIRKKAVKMNRDYSRELVKICGFKHDLQSVKEFPELVLGVGRVAIEAGMKSCPVISVNKKRMGEIITPENYLRYKMDNFVNTSGLPPDTVSLFNAIDDFFTKREVYNEQSSNLTPQFVRDFSIDTVVKTHIAAYQKLCVSE
ncbi:MAG: glycosyltransferase [Bacteroidales bacterium]